MLPSSHGPARAGRILAAAVVLGLVAPAAFAQQATPYPVVDGAPKRVAFTKSAVVRGHLENGAPGDEVAVQKQSRSGAWSTLQTKPVDENGDVTFRLRDRRTTSLYRLMWIDPTSEVTRTSDSFRISVRAKMTMTLRPRHPFAGNKVVVKGALRPARGGRKVWLQRKQSGEWRTVAKTRARRGEYRMSFNSGAPGYRNLRVVFRGDELNSRRVRNKGLKVYDPDLATWYGPGLYGNRTACGQTLTENTVGVAHRSLPCGTMVHIIYRGRTVRVPVIDRGPYTSAEWDLTNKVAKRLGFSGRNTIGTVH